MSTWDEQRLRQFIDDQIEESLTLDYKAAAALGSADKKKKEVTKDVSAMANSAGGIIIYGIAEHDSKDRRHLPKYLDPIDRLDFSKERLEQIINNIRPRVEGVVIHPVPLSTGSTHVAYVVEIPQSMTAHQAIDYRYYKRYNFESVPMDDYEIRDIMGRSKQPIMRLEPFLSMAQTTTERQCHLHLRVTNMGNVFAQYVSVVLWLPQPALHQAVLATSNGFGPPPPIDYRYETSELHYVKHTLKNTVQDVVAQDGVALGPPRYDPILPQLSHTWTVRLADVFQREAHRGQQVWWEIYADSAAMHEGNADLGSLLVI